MPSDPTTTAAPHLRDHDGKLLCTVQGNDHYDTDYAPCSGCREMAEAIAASKEAGSA